MNNFSISDLENENLYLNKPASSPIMKAIIREQNFRNYRKRSDCGAYSSTIFEYNKYMELIAKFFIELGVTHNSILYSLLVSKFMREGYFSLDNKFDISTSELFYDIISFEGIDIIDGTGCCRHVASFYDTLSKKLAIPTKIFPCYFNTDNSYEKASNNELNHAANLIKYRGNYYCYDVMSKTLLKPVNAFQMEEYTNFSNPFSIYYKPSSDMMFYDASYDEALHTLFKLQADSRKEHISYDEYVRILRMVKEIIQNNRSLIEDFKEEGKKYTKRISDSAEMERFKLVDEYYS